MTILTKITLSNDNREVIHLLKSRERIHALILRGLDFDSKNRVLWRDEQHGMKTILYVLSEDTPNYDFIFNEYDRYADVRSTSYDGLLRSLQLGQKYQFRLTCDPIINKNIDEHTRGKKVPLVGNDAKLWVIRKLEDSGLSDITLGDTHDESKFVFFKNKGHKVTVRAQSYNGITTVSDVDELRKCLINGVGPAKAYGCGMLLLLPVR